MAFFLPAALEFDTAPRPTDDAVSLVEVPARTLAVASFSWWPTQRRVAEYERHLERTLADAGIDPAGDPFLLGYDPPGTPPFLRRNEVAVEVRNASG